MARRPCATPSEALNFGPGAVSQHLHSAQGTIHLLGPVIIKLKTVNSQGLSPYFDSDFRIDNGMYCSTGVFQERKKSSGS